MAPWFLMACHPSYVLVPLSPVLLGLVLLGLGAPHGAPSLPPDHLWSSTCGAREARLMSWTLFLYQPGMTVCEPQVQVTTGFSCKRCSRPHI